MDPDQTEQSDPGLHCLLERLLKHFSRRQILKQTTFVVIGTLRAKIVKRKMYLVETKLVHFTR